MSTVHTEIEIRAPRQRVWETIMDPEQLGDWVTIHRSLGAVSAQPMREGSTMDQVIHIRGVSFKVHWTLEEMSAPNVAVWDGKGPARSSARIRYELVEVGEGATTFKYSNEFKTPGGVLGSMASKVIVGAASEREAQRTLSGLKALLERS